MIRNDLRAKALIIDESPNWQVGLNRICGDLGFDATVASTLKDARDKLDSISFAVIILDMIPSDEDISLKNGEQVLPEIDIFLTFIVNQHIKTPIMLFSGSLTIFDTHNKLTLKGMRSAPLLKKVSAQEIADTIKGLTGISTSPFDTHFTRATDIFIVHGRDELAKKSVSEFIKGLGLKPIVLSDQIIAGKTIIEGIEHYTNASFVVVLLTPDDIGYLRKNPKAARPRARQNVILELGFCIGKLGRPRVCALFKEGVDLPSDIHGMRYISMDSMGTWKKFLGLEIKEALKNLGLDVDLTSI